MRVEILYDIYSDDLRDKINKFIENRDIKNIEMCEYKGYLVATITYEEKR